MNLDVNSSKSIDVSEFDIRKEMITESLKDKLIGRQQNIFSKLGNSIDNKFKFAEDVKGQGSASRYKRQNSSSRKDRQTTYKKKKQKNRELKELNMLERLNTKYEKHNQNVLPRSDIVLKKLKGWRKIKNISDNYRDDLQLLNMRKKAYYRTSLFCLFCKNFQKSTMYVLLMQATLLFHLIIFILYQARYQTEYYQNQQIKQGIQIYQKKYLGLLSFYIIDLCLTAFGYGLIANKYSLLRGYLNLYNLTLTILFYIYISSENIIDFSPLRQINMLIYVGYFIKGIEKMVRALQQSVKYILEAVAIVLLITTFFALIGMILFKGLSNYKCVDQHSDVNNDLTNSEHNDESAWTYCRVGNCPADQICQQQAHTIDLVTNFNDIFNSFFQVLKVISMDKWAKTMYFAFRSFNSSVWVYFVLMILVGGIFGFNMVIAILKTYYSHNVLMERKKQINEINLSTLKELDLLQLISNWSLALTNLSQLSPVSSLKRSQVIRQLATNKSQVNFNKRYIRFQRFKLKYLLLPNLWTLSQNNQSQNISSQVQDLEQLILINRIQQNQESFSKEASFPQFTSSSQQDVKQKDKDTKFNKSNKLPMQYKIKKLNTNQDEIENQIRLPVLYSSDRMQYFVIHKKFERKQTNQRYSNVKSYYRSSRIIQNRFFEIEDKFVRKGTNMSPIRHQGKFTVFRPKGLFLKINGAYQGFNAISKIINQKIKNTNQNKIDHYENLYKEIFQIDYKNQKKTVKISSISKILKNNSKINNIQASLNTLQQQRDFLIYIKGFKGIILILRKNVALLYYQRKLYILFEFILLIYYISLCLQGDIKQQILDTIENITTIALLIEYFMKLVSLQEIKQQYLKLESSRKLQIVESIILFINFFDLAFGLVLHISDKNINLIKATKLLLFYRCLKYDKTAVIIGSIAQQTYKQYIYLGYLLLTVILTYALMGLEIFSHKFDEYGHVGQLNSFDDPFKAWLTVFNIMSHGDWYGILKIAAPTNQIFSFIYLFIIVFTLNYLVYGLVMAILLEAFNECLEVDHHQQKVHNNPLMLNIEEGIKYNDIGCKMTFNVFDKQSPLRIILYHIQRQTYFKFLEGITQTVIIIIFIVQSYDIYDYDYILLFGNIINLIIIFIKIIVFGFAFSKYCYMNSIIVLVDFLYTILFIINLLLESKILNYILFIRFFKPFMIIALVPQLKQTFDHLRMSFIQMSKVMLTIFIIWSIFAIFGMTLFKGQFGYCEESGEFDVGYEECLEEGKEWIISAHNFEDFSNSLQTLFVVSTFDDWAEIMQIAYNSASSEHGPHEYNSFTQTYIFFVSFQLIGSMFFISLYSGLLYVTLKGQESKSSNLNEQQKEFIALAEIIIKDKPQFSFPPRSVIRNIAHTIVNSKIFRMAEIYLTFFDSIVLMLNHHDIDFNNFLILNNIQNTITIIYVIINLLLLLSLGVRRFFEDNWRKFNMFIVVISLIDLLSDLIYDWHYQYTYSSIYDQQWQIERLLYSIRSLRMILLFQRFKQLQRLIRVISFAIPFLLRILSILFALTLSFAFIGNQIFGEIDKGEIIDDQVNFITFTNSMLTLLQCATVDEWRFIMVDTTSHNPYCLEHNKYCGSQYNLIYFYVFVFISNYMLFNLFVLGLIEQFEKFYQLKRSLLQLYIERIDSIKTLWCRYSQDTNGKSMHYRHLGEFLHNLGEPFIDPNYNLWDIAKFASYLKIRCDNQGQIYFNQLIYEVFRFAFKEEVFKTGTEQGKKQIKLLNKQFQHRIQLFRRGKYRQPIQRFIDINSNFNILHDYLNVLILFKTWQRYSKVIFNKTKNLEYSDQLSSDLHQDNDNRDILSSSADSFQFDITSQKNIKADDEQAEASLASNLKLIDIPFYAEREGVFIQLSSQSYKSQEDLISIQSLDGSPNKLF